MVLKRETTFTTDEQGESPVLTNLVPLTEYVVCRDEEAPSVDTFGDVRHLVEWLDGAVLGDLRTLVQGIQSSTRIENHTTVRLGGGNFLLAAGCCMAIEYFGQIYGKGRDGTGRARAYVKEFLAPIDHRYLDYFWLLWTTFRNGIVHGSWPQGVCIRGAREAFVNIGANNMPDGDHFKPASGFAGRSFVISSVRLFTDLESSFQNGFRAWVLNQTDRRVQERAAARLVEINPKNDEGVRQFEAITAMQP